MLQRLINNLKHQTATSINGITFKLTETNGKYEDLCLNPKNIPPDDLDDVILGRMVNGRAFDVKYKGFFYNLLILPIVFLVMTLT
jgi:hypothetical protein